MRARPKEGEKGMVPERYVIESLEGLRVAIWLELDTHAKL